MMQYFGFRGLTPRAPHPTNATPIIILTLRILAKDLWYYYAGNQVPVVYCPPLASSSSSSSKAVAIVVGVVYDYLMSW